MQQGNEVSNISEGRMFAKKKLGANFPAFSSADTVIITSSNFTIDECNDYVYKGSGGVATIIKPVGFFMFRLWQCGSGMLTLVTEDGENWIYDSPLKNEDYKNPSEHTEYFYDGNILIGKN